MVIEKRGGFTVTKRRVAYENPWIRVVEDMVERPDGSPGLFGIIEIGNGRGGVAILPIDDDGNGYLIREYMYAIDAFAVEVAGGGVDEGESTLSAAQREMLEEFGVRARTWVSLGRIAHATSIMRSGAEMYIAQGFDPSTFKPEEGILVEKYSLAELVAMVEQGVIQASTTVCMILLAARRLGQ